MAHAAKPAAAHPDMRLEHRLDPLAQGKIGITDDAGGNSGRPVPAAGAHRGETSHKLGLADRAHLRRPTGAVHRAAFEKHRRLDPVPGIQIREQIIEQIAMTGALRRAIPEMMVGVDDRQIGLKDRFRRLLGEPSVIRPLDAAPELGRLRRCCHASPPNVACKPAGARSTVAIEASTGRRSCPLAAMAAPAPA